MSAYIRSLLKGDITKDWIKKETVLKRLLHINLTLSKHEEKNKRLTDMIHRELDELWKKL